MGQAPNADGQPPEAQTQSHDGQSGDGRGPVDAAGLGQMPPAPPPPAYWPPPWPPRQRRIWPWVAAVVLVVAVMVLGAAMMLSMVAAVPAALAATSGVREVTYQAGEVGVKRIVVVPLEGVVNRAMEEFVRQVMGKLEVEPPAAVVLRVDSPGGGIGASDRVWQMLGAFRKQHQGLPVVTSMGSLGTSGGYYISVVADRIVAEPTCVTGSIGVMMPAVSIEGMLQKIGVTPHVTTSSGAPLKDTGSLLRAWTEQDRAIVQGLVDAMQERFVAVVAEGRGMGLAEARKVANGAPLTAQQALEAELVDEIGYLEDAIARAKELANLPAESRPRVTIFKRTSGILGWLKAQAEQSGEAVRETALEAVYPRLEYRAALR